jgi:hypothetical protein
MRKVSVLGADAADGSEPGLEFEFRGRSVDGWTALPGPDDRGCIRKKEPGDWGRPSVGRFLPVR